MWTAGIALAVPTFGVSLGVASGVNGVVSGVDIGIKIANGDNTGAAVSSAGMLLGLLIPGGGAALDSATDVAGDVGLDFASDNIADAADEIVSHAIDEITGDIKGQVIGHLAKKALGGLLQVDEGDVEVVSLKEYRKATQLHAEIKQRRRINKCYFDYVKRRDAVEGSTEGSTHKKLPKNLHLLKKMHREEKALASIWKNYKKAFAGDVEKLTNEFDAELATCRDHKNKMAGLLIRGKANLRRTKSESDVMTRGRAPLRRTKSESDLNTE